MKRWITALLVLALALTACGSDEDQVQDVVDEFFAAVADGDGEKACSLLTEGSRERLGGEQCSETAAAASEILEAPDVERIVVEGERATIERSDGADLDAVKVDGDWKLDGVN